MNERTPAGESGAPPESDALSSMDAFCLLAFEDWKWFKELRKIRSTVQAKEWPRPDEATFPATDLLRAAAALDVPRAWRLDSGDYTVVPPILSRLAGNERRKTIEAFVAFWSGVWLEHAVYAAMRSLQAQPGSRISDIERQRPFRAGTRGRATELTDEESEIDVVAVVGVRLVILECKHVDTAHEKVTNRLREAIRKVAEQAWLLGGTYGVGFVVFPRTGDQKARDAIATLKEFAADRRGRVYLAEVDPGNPLAPQLQTVLDQSAKIAVVGSPATDAPR